jgi:SAM-dependent methyltransferase
VEGYDASTYGERFADVYDEWYAGTADVEGTVAVLAELAGGGPVLELGVGTGRLAIPLVARGLSVHGVDASPAMVALLRGKPGGEQVHVTTADFADVAVDVDGGFALVFVAFNTFFNLPTAEAQQRCVTNVARLLRPGGSFVVEAFVPDPESAPVRRRADDALRRRRPRRAAGDRRRPGGPDDQRLHHQHHRGRHPAPPVARPLVHARPARRHGVGGRPGARAPLVRLAP